MAVVSAEKMQEILSWGYQKALQGSAGFADIDALAAEYAAKYPTAEKAAEALIANHCYKCAASGFITGVGGVMTLPIAVPADLASTLYMQLRMIAAIARLGGHDPHDDAVQTLAYLCLAGDAGTQIIKQAGIKASQKIGINLLKKLPGAVLIRINKLVGFRLITKFGTKGVVNLVKIVPLAGGAVGGGINYIATQQMGAQAVRQFLKNRSSAGAEASEPNRPGQDIICL